MQYIAPQKAMGAQKGFSARIYLNDLKPAASKSLSFT